MHHWLALSLHGYSVLFAHCATHLMSVYIKKMTRENISYILSLAYLIKNDPTRSHKSYNLFLVICMPFGCTFSERE